MLKHFKWALIVTATSLVICIVAGIAVVAWLQGQGNNTDKRAEMLGQGMGMLAVFVAAPFWIYGAYQFGKERRVAQSKPKKANTAPQRKPAS